MNPIEMQNLKEIQAQIKTIYNETMQKLNEIETYKKEIIQSYIKELEKQKIELMKEQLEINSSKKYE